MSLTLTIEDVDKLREIVADGVAKGLSDIGLGFDDEVGKMAIRADQEWTRRNRLGEEDRRKAFRRGLMSTMAMAGAGCVLYLAVHLHDLANYLTHLAEGNPRP